MEDNKDSKPENCIVSEKIKKTGKLRITAYDVAMVGMTTALIVASKEALSCERCNPDAA